jgi:hypothetical protein
VPSIPHGRKTVATPLRSTTSDDTHFGPGVSYLSLGCGGLCQSGQEIYQDIPITKIKAGLAYDFALSAVSHGSTDGTLSVKLDQINSKGSVLHSDSFTVTVPTTFRSYSDANSVYLAETFASATSAPISILPGAAAMRFSISPLTSNVTVDVVDTWVMQRGAQ